MRESGSTRSPSLLLVCAAFAAIYLIWGSTYLAIAVAIETIPPFLMAGVRFLIAGGIVYAWARVGMKAERPTLVQWRSALIIGGLMLLGGNGGVVWSEQRVASGVAAIIVATVPIWVVLINWLRPRGIRPAWADVVGVTLGFIGLLTLIDPTAVESVGKVDRIGVMVLALGSLSWSFGTIFAHQVQRPKSPFVSVGMEMLCGGVLLTIAAGLHGDWGQFAVAKLSLDSVLAFLYLLFFGSVVAFTAYMWLLRVSTPSRVATYAYVNPVVAVLLGWMFRSEPVSRRMVMAMIVILAGVIMITTLGARARSSRLVEK